MLIKTGFLNDRHAQDILCSNLINCCNVFKNASSKILGARNPLRIFDFSFNSSFT